MLRRLDLIAATSVTELLLDRPEKWWCAKYESLALFTLRCGSSWPCMNRSHPLGAGVTAWIVPISRFEPSNIVFSIL